MISKIFCFLLILLAILALISIFKEIKNIKNKTKIYIIEVILNIISVLSLLIGSLLYIIVDKFSFNHTSYIVYIIVTLSCLIKLSIKLLCKKIILNIIYYKAF
ncbi:hypothetical protein UT300018_33350 [Clostridium faecium]|uniref:hypothetical protein n=1 Tax=Clostridium faecium TaxID=2762223 RepID=UPI001A9B4F63